MYSHDKIMILIFRRYEIMKVIKNKIFLYFTWIIILDNKIALLYCWFWLADMYFFQFQNFIVKGYQ